MRPEASRLRPNSNTIKIKNEGLLRLFGTHEDERTVLYKTKTDDIVQTTQSTHTCAKCM